MSLRFTTQQLAGLRHDAQLLIERAADQEDQLEALVASTESAVRQAEGAVSQGEEVRDPGDLHRVLSGQLERSVAGAAAAKRLLAGAHRQHTEARLLLARIEGDHRRGAPVNTAVLVVDDQDDARDLLAIVLENAGFSARTTNGLEALITAHGMRPGVIVMDVSMPVLDALDQGGQRDTPRSHHCLYGQSVVRGRLRREVGRRRADEISNSGGSAGHRSARCGFVDPGATGAFTGR